MTEYIDQFGRKTIIDVTVHWNGNIGFVMRKDRQSIAEAWEVKVVKQIVEDIQRAMKQIEENNVTK